MKTKPSAALVNWVRRYAAEASADQNVDTFVQHVDTAILDQLPEVAADPVLVAALHASTRTQFVVFLSLLEREQQELLLPPQAVDFALSIARRNLELNVLLKVYRIASAAVWEFFKQVAAAVPEGGPDRTDVLVYLWDHGGTWINEAIDTLIGVFYDERESMREGALAHRAETVRAVLQRDDLDVAEASRILDHPLHHYQTGLVLWSRQQGSADALQSLNEAAMAAAAAVDAHLLTFPAGRAEVWCWLATPAIPDLDAIEAAMPFRGVRCGIGSSIAGVEGFRVSHREAVDAQRHAVALAGEPRCIRFADMELACLVAGNGDAVRTFIARELGELADSEHYWLQETVRVFLDVGGNVERCAAAMYVHKNTIRYRLSQAEKLLGHSLADRRTQVSLALQCVPRYAGVPNAPVQPASVRPASVRPASVRPAPGQSAPGQSSGPDSSDQELSVVAAQGDHV